MFRVSCLSLTLACLFPHVLQAQKLPLGGWRAHLPFNRSILVSVTPSDVFCGADDGYFVYGKTDNSLRTVSKVEGLSDIRLSTIRHLNGDAWLLVGYDNGNIDLVSGNTIVNIPDLKLKNLIGSKRVNDAVYIDGFAFIATDVGILVLDPVKKEIRDTYFLNASGNNNPVHDVATDGTTLFAATDSGLFSSPLANPAINFFGTWTTLRGAMSGYSFRQMEWFDGSLAVGLKDQVNQDDSLIYLDGSWQALPYTLHDIRSLRASNGLLAVSGDFGALALSPAYVQVRSIPAGTAFGDMQDAVAADASGTLWIADYRKGLVLAQSATQYQFFVPNGPRAASSADIHVQDGQLWVGHAVQGRKWDNTFTRDGFSTFVNNTWTTYDKTNVSSPIVDLDTVWDIMALAVHPRNSDHVFLGSRGAGVVDFEGGQVKNYYNEFNSSLQPAIGNPGSCQTGGLAFDSKLNLWVVNSTVAQPLSVLRTDGTWQAYSFPGAVASGKFTGELMIDSYDQKWVDFNESGILVFDETGTLGTKKYRFLTTGDSLGGLPSNDVRAMAEDRDGQVWIGTAKGVAVFYAPSTVLDGAYNPDAQQILVQVPDGTYQYLLETDVVTAIAVDGANNKWFGTESSGVYLLSPDGTSELHHFTADNSPLLSDNITSIGIDQASGEVFIGTENGIISYRGEATEGKDRCENTYVFPNPVRPGYEGPIAITGVMANADIKITDVSGTLVYETTAQGGQGIWNGRTFNGEKVHTGVYLVFCSDAEGQNTCITKLLFIH